MAILQTEITVGFREGEGKEEGEKTARQSVQSLHGGNGHSVVTVSSLIEREGLCARFAFSNPH